jgi:hypothetical protein
MPTNIEIIRAHDFMKATVAGKLNFEESKKALMEIAAAPTPSDDFEIILDTRKAKLELSITDLFDLASELAHFRKAFSRKMAVLCPLERFDDAGFFALCAQVRDFQVRAFVSFEDAIEWLVVNET